MNTIKPTLVEEVKVKVCVVKVKPEASQTTCGCSSMALPTSQNKTGSVFSLPCLVLSLPAHRIKQE